MIATSTFLYYYQCSNCKTVMCAPVDDRFKCALCARFMRFLYSTPVATDEQRQLHARGVVYNPHRAQPQPWTCVRCGDAFTDIRPVYRCDGKCCRECVAAETVPEPLTPEQQARERATRSEQVRNDQERLDAAYRAAETK